MAVIGSLRSSSKVSALLVLLGTLLLSGCGVNNIPSYEEEVKAAWSQALNQYQRRADLIPNLVEVVRGYAAHERETLSAVVEARAKATQTTLPPDILTNPEAFRMFQQNQQALTSALARLMVVVEQYPDLKANQNFQSLQAQIEGTENRVAVARRDYILAVQKYNTEIRTFPGVIWAMLLYRDAKPKENFAAQPGTEQAPRVDFGRRS